MRYALLALWLLLPSADAALSSSAQTTVRQWLYRDGLTCGVVRARAQSELGYSCPTVAWSAPAAVCLTQLTNGCVPTDADGDGHRAATYGGDDCDDSDAAVSPSAPELCNGVDDDCDGEVDEGACTSTCTPTNPDEYGPNYLAGSPTRADIRRPADASIGTLLVLSGHVYDASCAPVPNATLDVWQAGPNGTYDFFVTRWYRGILVSDAEGAWELTTYVPPNYNVRGTPLPAHIHFLVTGPDSSVVTQLYFEGDPYLGADVDPTQLTTLVDDGAGGWTGTWDVVLP